MKTPVSLGYLITVVLLAAAAAALSYTSPGPEANLAALLLGVYALHLVSLRVVLRQYATSGDWSKHLKGEHLAEVRSMRDELDRERRELENRKAELEQRIEAAEQQWKLLREMIRDKVDRGMELPKGVAIESQEAWTSTPVQTKKKNGPAEESPRVHGRW